MQVVVTEALFNQKPVPSLKIGDIPDSIRESRRGITERLVVEHELSDALQTYHGKHIMGSARAFVGDVNSLTPEAPPYSAADGYAKGRLQYHPTPKTISVFNTTWEPLGYVDKVSTETIAGAKTFSSLPKVPETAFGDLAGPDVPSRSSVKAYIDSVVATAKSEAKAEAIAACYPAGTIYVEYPSLISSAPNGRLPGVWSDITAQFAGAFFRAVGGNAGAFGTGSFQVQQLLEHSHSHNHPATLYDDGGAVSAPHGVFVSGSNHTGSYVDDVVITGIVAPPVSGVTAGTENRPYNTAIKIWQKQ